jgi:hypothetical protein
MLLTASLDPPRTSDGNDIPAVGSIPAYIEAAPIVSSHEHLFITPGHVRAFQSVMTQLCGEVNLAQ